MYPYLKKFSPLLTVSLSQDIVNEQYIFPANQQITAIFIKVMDFSIMRTGRTRVYVFFFPYTYIIAFK